VKPQKDLPVLLLLTAAAVLVHGYHPYAEDAEIYLPNILRYLDPDLFPGDLRLFGSYSRLSLFPFFIAHSSRLTHLPLEPLLLTWHAISIFLLLLACRKLGLLCFPGRLTSWAGVGLVASLLTLPVAGTALYIMDQYLNPRNLTAWAGVFAITAVLEKKYPAAGLALAFMSAMHPLMAVFAIFYVVIVYSAERLRPRLRAAGQLAVVGAFVVPAGNAYHQAALRHQNHYVLTWQWYEWLGIVAPLAILWWMATWARRQGRDRLAQLCHALAVYGIACLIAALALSSSPELESLARLQPLRGLHLLYIFLLLFGGSLAGELLLKNHWWRWMVLFVPLCAAMLFVQLALFPASRHLEWPWAEPRNPWVLAFLWAREHTPQDALFALDPGYMDIAGEDHQGFRAAARRGRLADLGKDCGEVSMFPLLADAWWAQVSSLAGWHTFRAPDFQRLRAVFGVSWVVLQGRDTRGLDCPYQNGTVMVCRLTSR
jgi:hypothetical protein